MLVIPAGGCCAGSGVMGAKREMCQGPWCLLQWDKANCTCRGSRALKAHISRKTNRNAVRQITGTWLRLNKDQSWVNTNGGPLRKKGKKSNQHRAAYSRGNSWAICFLNSFMWPCKLKWPCDISSDVLISPVERLSAVRCVSVVKWREARDICVPLPQLIC